MGVVSNQEVFYLCNFFFAYLKDKHTERGSIYWFTLQLSTQSGIGWNQEAGTQFGFPSGYQRPNYKQLKLQAELTLEPRHSGRGCRSCPRQFSVRR